MIISLPRILLCKEKQLFKKWHQKESMGEKNVLSFTFGAKPVHLNYGK